MKIFVTGGSGFVGQSLLSELIKKEYEVFGLARSEKSRNIVAQLGATPVSGDLTNVDGFKSSLEGIDAVIHVAAMIEMWGDYDEFYKMNVSSTQNLLNSANELGVNKFIYISAAAVVADGNPLIDIDETYKPTRTPHDNYSKTKALAEQLIHKDKGPIQKIILRPPMIWGKNMRIIEEFREDIEKRGFPTIGDIDHSLATCHVKNLNAAIITSIESNQQGTYFITDGEKKPLRVFIKDLAKGYGLDTGEKSVNRNLALFIANTMEFIWGTFKLKGNPPMTKSMVYLMGTEFSIDDSKARKELGYKNVISMEEGLNELQEKT